jgi:predicted pyridoxine 5'-phosphate oxidase superfamily flavin-nucleotide-binding protein
MGNDSEYERWSMYHRWLGALAVAVVFVVLIVATSLLIPDNALGKGWQFGLAAGILVIGKLFGPRVVFWLLEALHYRARHHQWARWSGKYYAFDDIQVVIEPMGKAWQIHHLGVFTIMGLKSDDQTHRRVEIICGPLDYFRDDKGEWWFTDAGLSSWLKARSDQLNHLTRRFTAWWERDTLPLLRKQAGMAPLPFFSSVPGSPLPMAPPGSAPAQPLASPTGTAPRPAAPVPSDVTLSDAILACIDRSVLCWLATVDADGMPNVSPKEIFAADGRDAVLVADIASPTTVRNLLGKPQACLSFVDVFVQKGYKLLGTAEVIPAGTARYDALVMPLARMTGGKFRIRHVIRLQVEKAEPILAPSYRLNPEMAEADQIAAAMRTYGVMPRPDEASN